MAAVSATACPHRPPCPGCPRFGQPGVAPEARLRLATLAREAGLPEPEIHSGAHTGFRHRARLMVRGRAGSPKIGVFQEGSHRIVDIPRCVVHHPLVNEVAAVVKTGVRRCEVAPYADRPHRGALRAVQVVVARGGDQAQVVLVGNARTPGPLTDLAAEVVEGLGSRLQGLWWNGNPDRTNVILGPHWQRLAGEETLREEIAGVDVFFPPGAFRQSHPRLADTLADRVQRQVADGAVVAELHAGCGAIGLGLLGRAAEVRFNEVSPQALEGLARGLAARPAPERARARVAAGPAAENLGILDGADTVVVDPPRKGLDTTLREALAQRRPRHLHYVSCGLASFERDARELVAAGLELTSLEAWNLFPYTRHVETVAWFRAREGGAQSKENST